MTENRLLTTEELAKRLSISAWTARDLVRRGVIPAFRLTNRRNLFDWDEVLASLREHNRYTIQ